MNGIGVNTINPMLKKVRKDSSKNSLKQTDKDRKRFQRIRSAIKKQRSASKR